MAQVNKSLEGSSLLKLGVHSCSLEKLLSRHLGVKMDPGGDELLCLQAPVPPFIWDWVISGFPPGVLPSTPKAWKGSLCG